MKKNKLKKLISTVLCFSMVLSLTVIGMPKAYATGVETTLTFSSGNGSSLGKVIHDGDYTSTGIEGFQLDILCYKTEANATVATEAQYFGYFSASGINDALGGAPTNGGFCTSDDDNANQGGDQANIIVIKSNDGSDFKFKSIYAVQGMLPSSYTVKGYKDGGAITGCTQIINLTAGGSVFDLFAINSKFGAVDEVRISADNGGNWAYFNDITIETTAAVVAPTVTTQAVSSITSTTATGNGYITALGTPNPTAYGVCWGTSVNPDVTLATKTTQGAASATGAFTSPITGLTPGTTYHVRAYATNTAGTSYGDDVTFTTAETTENFSDEIAAATTFTNNSFSFSLAGGHFSVTNHTGYGWTGTDVDAYYVDNVSSLLVSAGLVGSIQISSGTFKAHSIYIFPGENSTQVKNTGTVIIRGKLDGTTQFTKTVASADINTSGSSNNGWTLADFGSDDAYSIDTLEFELTGALRYLAIDAFKHESTVAAAVPTVTDAKITISGATGTGGTYKIDDTITATWDNTAATGDNNADVSSVKVDFSAFGGGTEVTANNSSGTWTAAYTIAAGSIVGTNKNVSVTATNAGGSTTTADTTNATVDNQAPTVSITSSASNPTKDSPIAVTITFSENVTGFLNSDLTLTNGAIHTLTDTNPIYSLSINPSGQGAVKVDVAAGVVQDMAGNANTAATQLSRTYDSVAPTAPTVTSAAASTNDTTPTWTWTAGTGGNGNYRCKLDNSDLTSDATVPVAASFTPGTGLSYGVHTLYVQERDEAGNWALSGSYAVTIVNTAPTVSDKTITSSSVSQTGVTLGWNKASDETSAQTALQYLVYQSSSDNLNSVANIETNGTPIGSYAADIATKDVSSLTAGTTYYFNVIVKDETGNKTCYTTKSVTTTAAGAEPTVTTSIDKTSMTEASSVATITATLSAPSALPVTVNLGLTGSATGGGTDYTASGTTITIPAGSTTGTTTITAVSDSVDEQDETVTVDITGVTNATESGTQQQTVTITDDDPEPTMSINNPTITEGNSGTVNLTFTVTLSTASGKTVTVNYATADGTATTANSDYVTKSGTITFNPSVTSLDFTVTINGDTANEPNETIFMNLTSPTNATISDAQGSGTIINDDAAAPTVTTVTSISPTSGPTAGGTAVTITGTNLSGATSVTLGGTAATSVTVVNATTITATTPAGTAGNANVVVTTPGGSGTGSGLFTYVAAPTVTSISPTSGPMAGGTAITIIGTNLSGATSVTIGGTAAIGVAVVNATTITATTPAGAAGAANVVVTTPGGTGTGSGLFTYVSTDVTPPSSPTYSPANSTTNVAVSITPALTFSEALCSNASATAMGAAPTGVIKVYEGTSNTGTSLTEGPGADNSDYTVAYNSTTHVFTVIFGASLKNSQSYYVELLANKVYDTAGNAISSAQGVTFTTKAADITAPVLSATSSSSVTSTGATLNFTSNEAGTYYYLVYAGAATAPNAATVKAQGAAVAKGTAAATALANTAAVTGLSASTAYKAYVIVEDAAGNKSAVSAIDVTTTAASTGGSGGGSPAAATPTVVEVDGQAQDAGTSRTETVNGKVQETITVDAAKLDTILDKSGDKPIVTLPSRKGSAVTVGEVNGQTVKNMENKEAVLEIRTGTVTYTLPASQINIDSISSQFGSQVALKDIKVSVKIAEPAADAVKAVEDTASKGHYQLVVKPLEFEITCTSGNKTVGINKFKGFVERTVVIPAGVDPKKITTGIVLNADGTFRHVPTEVITVGGKYYAKINSLTNSTYSVIYNPVAFTDVANHWAKAAINDMGSRMVVTGVGSSTYEPDRSITRAEFAAIAVRAMGLAQGTTESSFADVSSSDWFNGYVDTATVYSLITGYDNTSYGPNDTITREQAMAILARAMKLTGLSVSLTDSEVSAVLANYTDGASVSGYAKASAAACIKTGIVSGTGATTISPKAFVTRAEVAVMVQRMLQKAELI